MCLLMSLIPASIIAAIGYLVLVSSGQTEGLIRTGGMIFSVWLFVIAVMPLAGGAYVTLSGKCPMGPF
jgi:hypothetical protein